MADKNTIKSWFETGDTPSQAQFWAWIESFWHKDEKIPITAIDDIENILNEKADAEALTNHVGDANAHAALFAKNQVFQLGTLQVFKTKAPSDEGYQEGQQIGDYCIGFVFNDDDELEFINANYVGGDIIQKSSYNI